MNKPGNLIAVQDVDNELEAHILQSVLQDNGIPSLLQPALSLPGASAPAVIHGAVSIMVPGSLAEQANKLIASDSDEIT